MNRQGITGEFLAEVFGTFILILLGDGVVANVGLAPRLESAAYNWNTIVLGWGMAVAIAVYVAGGVTGAHINPAVTIALAVKKGFPWGKVPVYIIAQMLGAFLGAAAVWLVYMEGLQEAGNPNVWCTGPGSVFGQAFWGAAGSTGGTPYSLLNATIAEIIGTAMLLIGVVALTDGDNLSPGSNMTPFLVGILVLAIGLSLGGPSGYAINPARDFGPRLWGAISGTTGLFTGAYWIVAPIIGPIIGGVIGVFLYDFLIKPFLPKKQAVA